MATPIEEDDLLLPFLLRLNGLADGNSYSMVCLRGADKSFGPSKSDACLEGLKL
jgi:hypothetical protein